MPSRLSTCARAEGPVGAGGDGLGLRGAVEARVVELVEQEREEAWIIAEVARGAALPGLYPMNPETRARYEADRP